MPDIDQIICQESNPFGSETLKVPDFWVQNQDQASTVNSIHQQQFLQLESVLDLVIEQKYSKTAVLSGDSGSGKSHLLARLKHEFNPKAFFAYIEFWVDDDYMWRHILRRTVDSLLQIPEGEQESQLLLWLKGLTIFQNQSIAQRILGERNVFINDLSRAFPSGLYNARNFFSVLFHLTNPELYPLACDWLKGEDLAEEDLRTLGVRRSIDSEDAAQGILINFATISSSTKPIVLCFDNLDNLPSLPDGTPNFKGLFNFNSTIHTRAIRNLFILISVVTNTWGQAKRQVPPADLALASRTVIRLKDINLDQAEALWAMRLYSLHAQATPQPRSSIYPLNRQQLQLYFPNPRARPRNVLEAGRQLFQQYKNGLVNSTPQPETVDIKSAFQLLWRSEYREVAGKISRVTTVATTDLIQMLVEALQALGITEIRKHLLNGAYSGYSLSYQKSGKVGVVWAENANMKSFYNIMKACQRANRECDALYLIRVTDVGTPRLSGHRIYREVFSNPPNKHIRENLTSVHHLATYHKLVKDAVANELIISGQTISLEKLEKLIRESKILQQCKLLRDLGIFGTTQTTQASSTQNPTPTPTASTSQPRTNQPEIVRVVNPEEDLKRYLVNQLNVQQFMGLETLINNAHQEFPELELTVIENVIKQLCEAKKVKILDPDAPRANQLIISVPRNA